MNIIGDIIMHVTFLIKGLIIGLIIGAPLGPVGMFCVRRIIDKGRVAGLFSGLGAAAADALIGSIAAFGLTYIANFLIGHEIWVRFLAGGIVITMGLIIFLSKPSNRTITAKENIPASAFISTFLFAFTNPMTILTFLALFTGMGIDVSDEGYFNTTIVVLGVFLGSAIWWIVLSFGISHFKKILSIEFETNTVILLNRIIGTIIILLGFLMMLGFKEPIEQFHLNGFHKIIQYSI